MLNVALTGNIAAGQSPGSPVLAAIAGRFGADLIDGSGRLDRAALRRRVLSNPAALADLNRLVHPVVLERRTALEAEARARGDRIVISDIPLLFEASDPAAFDAVILVDAPAELRRARLVASRGLSADEAEAMLAAQAASGPKRARSTYVIDK